MSTIQTRRERALQQIKPPPSNSRPTSRAVCLSFALVRYTAGVAVTRSPASLNMSEHLRLLELAIRRSLLKPGLEWINLMNEANDTTQTVVYWLDGSSGVTGSCGGCWASLRCIWVKEGCSAGPVGSSLLGSRVLQHWGWTENPRSLSPAAAARLLLRQVNSNQ